MQPSTANPPIGLTRWELSPSLIADYRCPRTGTFALNRCLSAASARSINPNRASKPSVMRVHVFARVQPARIDRHLYASEPRTGEESS
jgi:hypothetical protein